MPMIFPTTVGDMKRILEEIPDETPIVRLSCGYYGVVKQDVSMWHGTWNNGRTDEDKEKDDVDCTKPLLMV